MSRVEITTKKRAHESGEFETRVDAVAFVAGAMLAHEGADSFNVHIEQRPGSSDPNAAGSFLWQSPPYWLATVHAEWPTETQEQPDPPPIDVSAVRDALEQAVDTQEAR